MEFWGNAVVLVLLWMGYNWLWVAYANRLLALPWRCETLDRLRRIHDFGILAGPFLFLYLACIHPGLLMGASFSESSLPLQLFFIACLLGCCGLIIRSGENLFLERPANFVEETSEVIDFAARLPSEVIKPGPGGRVAKLPGNEILRVEFNEKTFLYPKLPDSELRILHISDFHYIGTIGLEFFEAVIERIQRQDYDLITFTGDLLERDQFLNWVRPTLGRLSAPLGCWYILGNHDWHLVEHEKLRAELQSLGWHDLGGQTAMFEHGHAKFLLAGTERPWFGSHPTIPKEREFDFRILLAHTPDYWHWAIKQKYDLVLAGHNHGGQIRLPAIGPVYSPSKFGCRYASGEFGEDGRLMNVSRGLSGRHPIRYNCLPEVTTIVLRGGEPKSPPSWSS